MDKLQDLQRYELDIFGPRMITEDKGRWLRYEDVEKLLQKMKQREAIIGMSETQQHAEFVQWLRDNWKEALAGHQQAEPYSEEEYVAEGVYTTFKYVLDHITKKG